MPDLNSTSSTVPESVWNDWQRELQSIGVTNPLVNFERSSYGQIDLAQSHPGGFSQFVAGRATTLSSLVRDPQSFAAALGAARRIKNQAEKISQQFGLDTLGLIAGVTNLQGDGFDLQLPVLIWPIRLTSRGEDYEIELTAAARVNPSLVEAFEACYSVVVDEEHLLKLAAQSTEILPASVIYYLQGLVVGRATADVQRTLVIANFTTAPVELVADMKRESTVLLSTLANHEAFARLPLIDVAGVETVADADLTQQRIVARALRGENFAVETLPGCGYTQTVINTVSALALDGKRVVISAGRRQTLNELADRFSELGLPGLAVRSSATWLDVIAAISRHEKAQPVDTSQPRTDLAEATAHFQSYTSALERRDTEFDISIGEVLQRLALLSSMPHAPETGARIEKAFLQQHQNREPAIALLQRAEELGEFKFGPEDSAWFQAKFDSPEEVRGAIEKAQALRDRDFSVLRQKMAEFTERVNFKPADSVEQWGAYLRLFVGIRDTLDRFIADVFDRPLTELITATASRKETGVGRSQMSGGNRRRLKKLAKEYLRPAMHVADLNLALRQIQEQREQWHLYSNSVAAPQVPLGLSEVQEIYESFVSDLDRLERHLDSSVSKVPMLRLSLAQLERRFESLVNDTDALNNLEARAALSAQLAAAGLEPLKRELARLHTPREHIAVEFDLCWWQSILEVLIQRDSTVLNFNAQQIAAIESAFCDAEATLVDSNAGSVAFALAERWRAAVKHSPKDAESLKSLLKTSKATLAELPRAAGSLLDSIASVVLVSPFEAPAELAGQQFDVAIIMDAAGSTVAENLAVIRRANQLIAFGDEAISSPEGFEIESRLKPIGREIDSHSVFEAARRAFGFETLRVSYRGSGQTLGALVNREFYQNRIIFEPTPADFAGHKSHVIEIITEGANANSTYEGATESPEAEVRRVVDLVMLHAGQNPGDSLFVASASSVHADRIRSLLKKDLTARPELEPFFDAHGAERFEVVSIADLAHRIGDRIIFSVGFGLTPRGGVSSDFGQLSLRDGRRYLTNTLVSARKQFTVVSCITAEVIPSEGMGAGAKLLRTLLSSAEVASERTEEPTGDSLLSDLALRLKKLGARVDTSFFAERLPLVAAYGGKSAVVMPDWALEGETLSEKLRLRSNLLASLGWIYIRVHSFELFSDPQAVALRIAEQLGMQVSQRPQRLFESEVAFEDTDAAWGDRPVNNDDRLRGDVPPHWQ